MSIVRHIPWRSKPPEGIGINWSHPLSRGLIRAYLFQSTLGTDETGNFNFITGALGDDSMTMPTLGADGLVFDGVDQAIQIGFLTEIETLDEISVLLAATPTATDSMAFSLFEMDFSDTDGQVGWVNTGSPPGWRQHIGITNNTYTTAGLPLNIKHQVGWSFDSAENINFLDGHLESNQNPTDFPLDARNTALVGVDPDGADATPLLGNWYTGEIHYIFIWARALGVAGLKTVSDNPWQLFTPRTQILPTSVVAVSNLPSFHASNRGIMRGINRGVG